MSCLARGAQVAVERDADTGMARWHTCGLCKQDYHGVVLMRARVGVLEDVRGRPEGDLVRGWAMTQLGNGLSLADHHEDALSVREAELSMKRRLGAPEHRILVVQTNLASTYSTCLDGLKRPYRSNGTYTPDVWSSTAGNMTGTFLAANNYANCLHSLGRFEEATSLLRENDTRGATRPWRESRGDAQDAVDLREGTLRGQRRHPRRSPPGRDDARGHGTDRAARDGWRATRSQRGLRNPAIRASRPPRPRSARRRNRGRLGAGGPPSAAARRRREPVRNGTSLRPVTLTPKKLHSPTVERHLVRHVDRRAVGDPKIRRQRVVVI